MQVMINIGGQETPVEMPDNLGIAEPTVTFGDNDISIVRFGNYVKVSGLTTIRTATVRDVSAYMEGSVAITFPVNFHKLTDYQATALDNNTGSLVEHAHVGQVTNTGMNVYATTFGSEAKDIQVKWTVEGLL